MASTCFTCGIGYIGGCCPTCQPAQSIFQGECQDPGTHTVGRFLQTLDYKFCAGRLTNAPGFLVSNVNGSGNASFAWTTTPQVALNEYAATADTAFGNLIVMGADYRWRYLSGPATLGLFLQTDATGNLIFGDAPAAVVPDPLVINDLSVAATASIAALTTTGTVTLNNTPAGTPVNLIGLNASNEIVTQNIASSIGACMFYESATSPGADTPNAAAANGSYLVIGNRLYDSGSNLITVTTSQALTVAVAGKYDLFWEALLRMQGGTRAMVSLEINGVIVNNGNGRNADVGVTGDAQFAPFCGTEVRNLAVGDVIKLQVAYSGTSTTFNVRLRALKFAD